MTKPVARDKPAETSVMANTAPGESQAVDVLEAVDQFVETATVSDKAVQDMASLVKALQARLDQLEGRADEAYGEDDKLFIAKPNGENWVERQLDRASKSYVDVEMRATAFYGPFNTAEAVAAYLAAKRSKREDSYVAWENVRTVTGREKRKIEATERADRESMGQPAKLPGYFASGR